MKLLAIDTHTPVARWVGVEEGRAVRPVEREAGKRHDAVLAEGIARWLRETGWSAPDGVAVVTGPGGYTGLRVGVAFATAFAAARDLPVVAVSSWEVEAARAREGMVWVLLPARRGMLRGRLMRGGDLPEAAGEPEELAVDSLEAPGGAVIPLGEGYERHRGAVDRVLGTGPGDAGAGTGQAGTVGETVPAQGPADSPLRPPAEALAAVAWAAWMQGRTTAPVSVDVEYGAEFLPTPKKNPPEG